MIVKKGLFYMNDMQAIDIARRMAELGQKKEACQAYTLAIADTKDSEIRFEAALYILQNGGNYQVSYDVLLELYRDPDYCQDAFSILTEAFYLPNEKQLKNRYEKNCKVLQKYPYLFRKDFPKFEELPIRFYPFDDTLYVPFNTTTGDFQKKVNFNYPQITHYFFRDLSKPVLARNIFSQYELEYLKDNVRASEDVAKENHIYLHYTCWEEFCAHLQVLNMRDLLERKKIVFLMEDEIGQYPIDFKEKYNTDYSLFPLTPPALEEYTRLIWHTQLSAHNGGDFFNEIFDNHPNLVMLHSFMLDGIEELLETCPKSENGKLSIKLLEFGQRDTQTKLSYIQKIAPAPDNSIKKSFLVRFLSAADLSNLDPESRISPAVFFQPHFPSIKYEFKLHGQSVQLESEAYEQIRNFPVFQEFKYLKTFTPMRRFTTRTAATIRFQRKRVNVEVKDTVLDAKVVTDDMMQQLLNRSYMVDWQDRLYKDSTLVRFEDAKMNPKATFTALAQFLDLPYAASMDVCSVNGEVNAESLDGNYIGFSKEAVYRTYDEYLGDPERYLIEYFLRDVYKHYGYDFHYYDGEQLTNEQLVQKIEEIQVLDRQIFEALKESQELGKKMLADKFEQGTKRVILLDNPEKAKEMLDTHLENIRNIRKAGLTVLMNHFRFVNKNGQPLNFMPMLKLDPELLENPIYH